jgi:cytochrome P450 family 307 subfamily A
VNTVASAEVSEMVKDLKMSLEEKKSASTFLKPFLMDSTFKIFTKYFCNVEITEKNAEQAKEVMKAFDDVFQEVNSQCVGDLFPFLMPICGKGHLPKYGEIIRDFTMNQCVQPRLAAMKGRVRMSLPDITEEPEVNLSELRIPQRNSIAKMEGLDENNNLLINGFIPSKPEEQVDNILDEFLVNIGKLEDMTLDNALFAFEDILGGHSAIANFLSTVVIYLAQNPIVRQKVREEVRRVAGSETITLEHKLPYCESVVWESARCISSLLVPHVANQDTYIGSK